jgi:membrane protease subunit HflC
MCAGASPSPVEYIRNVGLDESAGANQLNRVVRNAFQEEINKRTVKELLSTKRDERSPPT